MVWERSWRSSPGGICRHLERIETGKVNENKIKKLNKVYQCLKEQSLHEMTFGIYRQAAEKYDRTRRNLIGRVFISGSNSLPPSLKSHLMSYSTVCIERSPRYAQLNDNDQVHLYNLASEVPEIILAHLFGNRISCKGRDDFSRSIEGMRFLDAFKLVQDLMLCAAIKHPHIFNNSHQGWKTVKKLFACAKKYLDIIDNCSRKNVAERKKDHDSIAELILHDLDALQEGGQIGIPWGWNNSHGGHALFLIVIKKGEGFLLEVYNTGKGLEYHPRATINGIYKSVIRMVYRVSTEQVAGFRSFLKYTIEPRIYGDIDSTVKFPGNHSNPVSAEAGYKHYSSKELYYYLNQYEIVSKTVDGNDRWSQGGLSGNCTVRCLHAVLGQYAKDLFEPYKVFSHAHVLRLFFTFPDLLIKPNETIQKQLAHGLSNLGRHHNKPADDLIPHTTFFSIAELESWHETLLGSMRPQASCNPPLDMPKELISLTSSLKKICNEALNTKKSSSQPETQIFWKTPPSPPLWCNTHPISAKQYDAWLEDLVHYSHENLTEQKEGVFNQPVLLTDALYRECYLSFMNPCLEPQRNILLSQLCSEPVMTASIMKSLGELLHLKSKSMHGVLPHGDGFVVGHGLYCVLVELAMLRDNQEKFSGPLRLNHYSLASPFWEPFSKLRVTEMCFHDPSLVGDFVWITQQLLNFKGTHRKNLFNHPNNDFIEVNFSDPIIEYIDAHIKGIPESLKEASLKAYEKSLGWNSYDINAHPPSYDKWLQAWIYRHAETCLPDQYHILSQTYLTLANLTPWNFRGYREIHLGDLHFKNFSYEAFKIEFILNSLGSDNAPHESMRYPPTSLSRDDTALELSIIPENDISASLPEPLGSLPKLAAAVAHPIRIITLIDGYKDDLDKFRKWPKHRCWFGNVFCSPKSLSEVYIHMQKLSHELTHFFEQAIDFYTWGLCEDADGKEAQKTISFLYWHYCVFLLVEQTNPQNPDNNKLREFRKKVRNEIEQAKQRHKADPEAHIQLLDAYLMSFHAPLPLTEEEVHSFITCLFALRKKSDLLSNSLHEKFLAFPGASAFYKHQEEINQCLNYSNTLFVPSVFSVVNKIELTSEGAEQIKNSDQDNTLAKKLAEVLRHVAGIRETISSYDFSAFPKAVITTEKGVYTFDLMEGRLVHSTVEQPGGINADALYHHKFYQILLSNKLIKCEIIQAENCCTIEEGGVRYIFYANHLVHKEENGKVCIGSLMPDVIIAHYKRFENYIFWVPLQDGNTECLMEPLTDNPIKSILRDGRILFHALEGEWELVQTPSRVHPLLRFNADTIWVRMKEQEGTSEIPDSQSKIGVICLDLWLEEHKPFILLSEKGCWKIHGHDDLHISSSQEVKGLELFGKYLVVDNVRGPRRMALVPFVSVEMLSQAALENSHTTLISIELSKERITLQTTPLKNIFCAYLLYKQAKSSEEYLEAFEYLKAAKILRRYTQKEIIGFALILDSNCADPAPAAIAFRLNATLMAKENESQFKNKERENVETSIADDMNGLFLEYLSKLNDIPVGLRIEENLSKELIKLYISTSVCDESTYIGNAVVSSIPCNTGSSTEISNVSIIIHHKKYRNGLCEQLEEPPVIATRPGKDILSGFEFLLGTVISGNLQSRKGLEQLLRFAHNGGNRASEAAATALFMELYAKDDSLPDLQIKAIELKNTLAIHHTIPFDNKTQSIYTSFQSALTSHLLGVKDQKIELRGSLPIKKLALSSTDHTTITSETEFLSLFCETGFMPVVNAKLSLINVAAKSQKQTSFKFSPNKEIFAVHQKHFSDLYLIPNSEPPTSIAQHFTPPKNTPKEIATRINALNNEVAIGAMKNRVHRKMPLKKNPENPLTTKKLLQTEVRPSLQKLLDDNINHIAELEMQIVKLGNTKLLTDPKYQAEVVGNQKKRLTLHDIIALVIRPESTKIGAATGIQNFDIQNILVQFVGNYLEKFLLCQHTKECLKAIDDLDNSRDDDLLDDLQHVGYLLNYKELTIDHPDTLIQLGLQWACGFILRPNQRHILNQMFENGVLKDRIFQVLQADGKTFVLGPFLALLNADGEHLSIHVDPKHQHETTLSTLGTQIYKTIGKMPYTLKYKDSKHHFNTAYLEHAYTRLQTAIKKRVPVITTQDTLRSLRSRYIQMSIKQWTDWNTLRWNVEVHHTLDAMGKILTLIRSKGIFAPLEEVHEGIDPNTIHNVSSGKPYHFEENQLFIILELLANAMNALDSDGNPLLHLIENRQASQTPQQLEDLKRHLAEWCIQNAQWRKLAVGKKTDAAYYQALTLYLYKEKAPAPDGIAKKIKEAQLNPGLWTPLEYLLMTRQLIAGKWLETSLGELVFEDFMIAHRNNELPTAIRCEANMCPSLDSEFSNPYIMAMNTLIAAYVQGLLDSQVDEFINFTQQQAKAESLFKNIPLKDTDAFKDFNNLLARASLSGDLFHPPPLVHKHLNTAFKTNDPIVTRSLGNFICQQVLRKKELFGEEISTCGVSVATMAKKTVGYSGTVDNSYATVFMDHEGRKIETVIDEGTDGQTLHLLLERNFTVYVMGHGPENIFSDVIAQLPADKLKRFRLLVDGGSHFRGVLPLAAAQQMAQWSSTLKIPIKAVLSYDVTTRLPFAILSKETETIIHLQAHRMDEIAKELGLEKNEIGVFLPQFKASGTDLDLPQDTLGIYTVTENTPSYLLIQEVRRLRNLHGAQEAICALQQTSLGKMSAVLEKPHLANLNKGKVPDNKFIADVILFCYINRFNPLSRETYLLCMQNLKNSVSQFLLDHVYFRKSKPIDIFTKATDLFCDNIIFNFIKETGYPKTPTSQRDHLEAVANRYLQSLGQFPEISPEDKALLKKTLWTAIDFFLPALPEQILLYDASKEISDKKSETMVQIVTHQQQQNKTEEHTEIRQRMKIWERTSKNSGISRTQTKIESHHLADPNFTDIKAQCESPSGLDNYSLDEAMLRLYPDLWQQGTFSRQLTTSCNWISSKYYEINIGDKQQKPLAFVLLAKKSDSYSLCFTTQENAAQIAQIFSNDFTNPTGVEYWLLRPNGEAGWPGPSPYDKEKMLGDKRVRMLFVQALIFNGRIGLLNQNFWHNALEEWLQDHQYPWFVKRFFEECAIRNHDYDKYRTSYVHKLLRRFS